MAHPPANPHLDRPAPLALISSTLTSLLTSLTSFPHPHEIPIKRILAILQLWDKLRELDERLEAEVEEEVEQLERLLQEGEFGDDLVEEQFRGELEELRKLRRGEVRRKQNRDGWVAWGIMLKSRFLKSKLDHYMTILPLPFPLPNTHSHSRALPLPPLISSAQTEFHTDLELLFPDPDRAAGPAGEMDMDVDVSGREGEAAQGRAVRGLFLAGWEEVLRTGKYTPNLLIPTTPTLPIISTNIQRHISPLVRRERALRKMNVGRGWLEDEEEEEVRALEEVGRKVEGLGEREVARPEEATGDQEESVDMDAATVAAQQKKREEIRNGKRPMRKSLPARLAPDSNTGNRSAEEEDVFTNTTNNGVNTNANANTNGNGNLNSGQPSGTSVAKRMMKRSRPLDLEDETGERDIFSPVKRPAPAPVSTPTTARGVNVNGQDGQGLQYQPQKFRGGRQSLPNIPASNQSQVDNPSSERHAHFNNQQSSRTPVAPQVPQPGAGLQARSERSQTEVSLGEAGSGRMGEAGSERRDRAREIMGSLGHESAEWRRKREERRVALGLMRVSVEGTQEGEDEQETGMDYAQEQEQEDELEQPPYEDDNGAGPCAEVGDVEMDLDGDDPMPGQVEQTSAMEVDKEEVSPVGSYAAPAPAPPVRRPRQSMPASAAYTSQYQPSQPHSSARQPSVLSSHGQGQSRRVFSSHATTSQHQLPLASRRFQAPRRSLGAARSPAVATFQMPGMPNIEFPQGMLFKINTRGAFEPIAQMDVDKSPRYRREEDVQVEEGYEVEEEYGEGEEEVRSAISEVAPPPPQSGRAASQYSTHHRQGSVQSFLHQSGAPLPSTGNRLSVPRTTAQGTRATPASSSVMSPGSSEFGNRGFRVPQGTGQTRQGSNAPAAPAPAVKGNISQAGKKIRRHTELPPRPTSGSSRAGSINPQDRVAVVQRRHQRQSLSAIQERPGGASNPMARQLSGSDEDGDGLDEMGYGGGDEGMEEEQLEDEALPHQQVQRSVTPRNQTTTRPAASRIPIPSPRRQPSATPGPIKFVGNTHARLGLPSGTAPAPAPASSSSSSRPNDPSARPQAQQRHPSPLPQPINTLKRHRPFKDDRVLRDPAGVKRSRVSSGGGGGSGRMSLGGERSGVVDLISP